MHSKDRRAWLCARALRGASTLQALPAALLLALSACQVDFKDGVFACSSHADCPAGLLCDPQWKHCTRHPLGVADNQSTMSSMRDASSSNSSVGEQAQAQADAGQANRPGAPEERHADASAPERRSTAPLDAGQDAAPAPARDAEPQRSAGGGAGGKEQAAGAGSGGVGGMGGASAAAGHAAPPVEPEPAMTSAACPQDTYCYGFEAGALDPSGALWPSPSDGSGGLPPNQELTTAVHPASPQSTMLVSRPSAKDGWPKATVGFSGPRTPFSKLVVSFDYVAGDTLVEPSPRVILFRFVGEPERSGDSVNVGLLHRDVMLEVQTDGPDTLSSIGPAVAPGILTHVVATFTRSQASCTAEIAYADLPLKAAAFPCQVQSWQIELGLDMLETPPENYKYDHVAYFDNLRVSTTP